LAKKRNMSSIDPKLASQILRKVPPPEAFLFFTDIGKYTDESAPCLKDFLEKLERIPLESIEFHFKREDFERWIKETLSDEYLANRISRIDRSTGGEELRTALQTIVRGRLDQLEAATISKT